MGQETIKTLKAVAETMNDLQEGIKPGMALTKMMNGSKEALGRYEKLGNDARLVVNLWAMLSPEEQREFIERQSSQRKRERVYHEQDRMFL